MKNLVKPSDLPEIEIDAAVFRVRRLDARNLVIERQRADNGLWLIVGYYGSPGSLAAALVDLAATLPSDQAHPLVEAAMALAESIERNTGRIVAALEKRGSLPAIAQKPGKEV